MTEDCQAHDQPSIIEYGVPGTLDAAMAPLLALAGGALPVAADILVG
jgi:hypothetical protein